MSVQPLKRKHVLHRSTKCFSKHLHPQQSALFLCALTMLPVDLILGNDDLARVNAIGVADGMTQDADGSDHLTHFGGAIHSVAGVAD